MNTQESCTNLEELMMHHRIAVSPEYESQLWHAEVYDNESATPTRMATGSTPTAAVRAALQLAVPEYGDALDKLNATHGVDAAPLH